MSLNPNYAQAPLIGMAQISSANTNRDGTGTLVSVVTATPNGSRIERIRIQATVTTTAGMVRLFLFDGTNNRLYMEIPVTAATPSGTVAAFSYEGAVSDLVLPTGWILKAAPHNAETFNVQAFGANF